MASIRKRGKRWQVQVRRNGQAISRSFDTKSEAQQFAAGLEHDVLSRKYVPETATLRLRDALEDYLQQVSAKKKSHRQELPRIREWQDSEFATLPLDRITPQALSQWRDTQLQTRKPATVRLKLAILSHLYTVATKEWGMALVNPIQQMTLPSTANNGRERRLYPGEYKRLIKAAKQVHPDMADFIRLAVLTGMRRSEMTSLRWCDVDLTARTATLHDTKNGSRRVIPLGRRTLLTLKRRKFEYDFILNESTGRVFSRDPNRYTIAFKKTCREAGVEGLRLHDLRHEATSRFVEKGLSLIEVASITGHKTMSMLKRYSHPEAGKLADRL